VPFLLDARLSEAGARLGAPAPAWEPRVEVDGALVTGQNPASALPVAEAALGVLRARAAG
jgi:putative intracellular protease/amidase